MTSCLSVKAFDGRLTTSLDHTFLVTKHLLLRDAVEDIKREKHLKDNLACNPHTHTAYRSVLGQLKWAQSRTQAHLCYKFSRCASAATSPTIGDVREINKVVRTVKSQYIDARFWPLNDLQRVIGIPDASYRNDSDKSSQRAQCTCHLLSRRETSVQRSTFREEGQFSNTWFYH